MSAAREKLESLVRHLRQRQEREAIARAAWKKALPRCKTIAEDLAAALAGLPVSVVAKDLQLTVELPTGARATFSFDGPTHSLVGRRAPAGSEPDAAGEEFWSLRIQPPAGASGPAADLGPGAQWGPSRVEGVRALTATADSQEAFEAALANFFEWALIGQGAAGEYVRLP